MEITKEKPSPRRGRSKVIGRAQRRQSIVTAAHEAFFELGFARTTTAAVAARAKVSKRSIYEVFGALLPRRRLLQAVDRARRTQDITKRLEIFLRGIGSEVS